MDFDLMVVGGGAAAFSEAIKADALGVKTAMVERGVLGGTCVNVGCVPSKYLLTMAGHYRNAQQTKSGIQCGTPKLDFKKVIRDKNALVESLRQEKYADVLSGLKNVTLIKGSARFVSTDAVDVEGKTYSAKKFIIATGSSANIAIQGAKDVGFLTNVTALDLDYVPACLVVVGGGPLGLEFAQAFSRFGSQVTVLQRNARVLPRHEPEASQVLKESLEAEGIRIVTGARVVKAEKKGRQRVLHAEVNGKLERFECDEFLMAAGRTPNTKELSLEAVGVRVGKRGEIVVDDALKTSAPHVWAAGDVTGEPMLETVAGRDGGIAANNALTDKPKKRDLRIVPDAVFTDPQVAHVGLTDEQANAEKYSCNCRVLPMKHVPKAVIVGDTRGVIKMVADSKTNRILGVSIVSALAADMIHEAAMIVKNEMTVDDVIDTMHVFPTLSEAIKICAQSHYADVSKLSCCTA